MRFARKLLVLYAVSIFLAVLPSLAFAGTANDDPRVKAAFDKGWAYFAQLHKDIKNLDLAVAQYKEVLALYPENFDAMWKISEALFKKAEALKDKKQKKEIFTQSLNWAEKALAIAPQKAEPHYWVAVNCAMLADMAGALKAMNLVNRAKSELVKIPVLDPKSRFATLSKAVLGAIYLESPWPLRDLKKAEKLIKEAVAEDSNMTWPTLLLGKLYLKTDRKEQAKKEIARCLAISKPTYVWDSVLYDWPEAKDIMKDIK